ncbi:MAG: hypothetical protein ACR2M3_17840 [Thermomicrobiales bacterium]
MHNPTQHTTAGKRPGGQPGNTNGQTHGLFSTANPPTVADLRAMADVALEEQDVTQLRRIERAAKFHAAHAPTEQIARPYRQAEKMIRAARAMLDYDQSKEEQQEGRYEENPDPLHGSAGGADDWPADEPFTEDDPQTVSEWSTTSYPIVEQPPLSNLPDALSPFSAPQTGTFPGSRAARGTTNHPIGGQDDFRPAAVPSRRRH